MNGFQIHGIDRLSPSSINKAREAFDAWLVQYVWGEKFSFGWAALCGNCVEAGVNDVYYRGVDINTALDNAINKMVHESKLFEDKEKNLSKYLALVEKMFHRAVEELKPFGKPTPVVHDGNKLEVLKDQHKINVNVRFGEGKDETIPVIGFLDYYYADREVPLIIDLKTTSRAPSKWSLNHGIQAAIYKVAMEAMTGKEHEVRFLYCLSRQKDDVIWLTMDKPDYYMKQMKLTISQMNNFLSLTKSKEKLLQSCVHNPDNFYWSGDIELQNKYYGNLS